MAKVLETENIKFEMVDNILIATYKAGINVTIDIAKEVVKKRLEFTEGKSLPNLVYNGGVVSMDKAARDFFATSEGTQGVSAGAIILDSVFTSFLGNFFLKVSKPPIPAKLFTDEKKAIEWLRRYLNNG